LEEKQAVPAFQPAELKTQPRQAELWQDSPVLVIRFDAKRSVTGATRRQAASASLAVRLYEAFVRAQDAKTPEAKIAAYDQVIELDPESAIAFFGRGIAFLKKGDYGRAIADFTRAIQLDPSASRFLSDRAIAYAKQGELAKAMKDLEAALQLKPASPVYYNNRAHVFYLMRDHARALEDCNRAILLGPRLAEPYSTRGDVYHQMADHDLAIADFTAAIRLKPDLAEAYQHRALSYCEKGDYRAAWADVGLCQKLGWPVDPNLLRKLSRASAPSSFSAVERQKPAAIPASPSGNQNSP
jgi:tetratricopeptide (TPR) repeat protein